MAASPADRLDGLFKLRKADGWLKGESIKNITNYAFFEAFRVCGQVLLVSVVTGHQCLPPGVPDVTVAPVVTLC